MSLPGAGSPTQQIPGEFSADVALLQGQAQLAQALHNYIDIQNRVRQEEAITAAAQLLDPMAKLRLLRALQGQSLNGGLNGPDGVDPALLAALSGLSMGGPNGGVAAPARHSIDNSYVASGPTLGAFAAASAITAASRWHTILSGRRRAPVETHSCGIVHETRRGYRAIDLRRRACSTIQRWSKPSSNTQTRSSRGPS